MLLFFIVQIFKLQYMCSVHCKLHDRLYTPVYNEHMHHNTPVTNCQPICEELHLCLYLIIVSRMENDDNVDTKAVLDMRLDMDDMENLRKVLPDMQEDQRNLSQLDIILRAIKYIKDLGDDLKKSS